MTTPPSLEEQVRIDREPGEGTVLYFGERPGQRFIGVGLGFSGWENDPKTRTGWWRFMHPYVHYGRLFSDAPGRRYSIRLRLPAWLWDRIQDYRAWRR